MSLPTLLVKGSLRAPNDDAKRQAELSQWVPIEYIIDWVKSRRHLTGLKNRVLIVKAETASGKSTALPPELYGVFGQGGSLGYKGERGIICTQPRTLTAIRNVAKILSIPNYAKIFRMGDNIGWSTQFNKLRPKTYGLMSATVGTLAQQMILSTDYELIKNYQIILIDEAHERNLETDMTLYSLRNFYERNKNNPKCPFLFIMSATFQPDKFLKYFDLDINQNYIWCEGRSIGIDLHWDWNGDRSVNNFPQSAADVVKKIIVENTDDMPEKSDILIFMPGMAEIKQTKDWLKKLNVEMVPLEKQFAILRIDSEAQRKNTRDFKNLDVQLEYQSVYISGKKYIPTRRVIISTVFAETGVTIDSLKYVIDSGFTKEVEFNPNFGLRALLTRPASKSQIVQRMGRVGRMFKGHFYPLYPKYIFEKLQNDQLPQVILNDVTTIFLRIAAEQLKTKKAQRKTESQFRIEDINMIDNPSVDSAHYCLEKMYVLGFMSPKSPQYEDNATLAVNEEISQHFGLTRMGILASKITDVKAECLRMIFSGFTWNCSIVDLITIAAYMSIDPNTLGLREDVDDSQLLQASYPGSKSESYTGSSEKSKTTFVQDSDELLKSYKEEKTTIIRSDKKTLDVGIKKLQSRSFTSPLNKINWIEVYKLGLPKLLYSDGGYYKLRALIADDFINGVFLFNSIKYIMCSAEPTNALGELRKWCNSNGINTDTAVAFVRNRDNIINQLLYHGVDVFKNEQYSLSEIKKDNFINTITAIKYCIYDGFRLNIATKTDLGYFAKHGNLQVIPPDLFRNDKKNKDVNPKHKFIDRFEPKIILYGEMGLAYNTVTNVYDPYVERISTMDGFVNIDNLFDM